MAVTTDRIVPGRWRSLWLATTLVAIAGGSNADATVEVPQPVLVMHPGGGAESLATAFAGEVHARQESALAFRIGGNLVRRLVDVGERVHAGDVLAELDPGDQRL